MARRDLSGAVDFTVLESFAAHDEGVIEEVLNLFREQAQIWSPMLDVRSSGWRDAAHTVKGAAAGIGARELAELCGIAEQSPPQLAAPALARVNDALDRALADVAAYLHECMLQSLRAPT
jgi:HPt (histidine-containing phosphotransfer) domain-containing protein